MRGAGPGDEADGASGRETRRTGTAGRGRGGRGAGSGDKADGAPGRETRQMGTAGRETRQMGTAGRGRGGRGTGPGDKADGDAGPGTRRTGRRDSLPFRLISAVWVEIYIRRLWESLPFSRFFSLLGRDLRPAALGISTFFG